MDVADSPLGLACRLGRRPLLAALALHGVAEAAALLAAELRASPPAKPSLATYQAAFRTPGLSLGCGPSCADDGAGMPPLTPVASATLGPAKAKAWRLSSSSESSASLKSSPSLQAELVYPPTHKPHNGLVYVAPKTHRHRRRLAPTTKARLHSDRRACAAPPLRLCPSLKCSF
jgi:hypothetical protein